MLKKLEGITPPKKEWETEPAESFEIEFLNTKSEEVRDAMLGIGNFVFSNGGSKGENSVYFEGERNDGTKIRIVVEKGQDYKSPREIANEEATKEK